MLARFVAFLAKYQLALIVGMLVLGLIFPAFFKPLNPLNSFFLQVIMFATGLRLDFREVFREIKDWRLLLIGNGMMMIGIPILVSIPLKIFAPEWTLPFVIAAAMPTGLTAPAIINVLGGKTSLALLMSLSTSIVAPITIPLTLKIIVGSDVNVDVISMMWQITSVVVLPLFISGFIQHKMGIKRIERFRTSITLGNLLAFGLVVASIASASFKEGSANILATIGTDGIIVAVLMMIFWLGIAWLTMTVVRWRSQKDRNTMTFCLIYMSYALGIWVGDTFFRETGVAPKLVAIVILVISLFPVFKLAFPDQVKKKGPTCLVDEIEKI